MKQKIKEALRQEYKKRLELDDEQLNGVAAFAATFVTDEAKIEEFVKSEATLTMLKSYQSMLDKDRAKRKPNDGDGQQNSKTGNQTDPEPKPQPQGVDVDALIERFTAAVDAKLTPLQEKLNAFEAAKAKEDAVAALDNFVNGWDYASGFPKERDLAKRVAMKIYKAGGEQMSGDELIATFRDEFDPAVKERGVTDFSKPFKSDGGGGEEADLDMESVLAIYKKSGRIADK